MMFPGIHLSPPYILTPKYFGKESLLFCVDPPCFLEAHLTCWSWLPAQHSTKDALATVGQRRERGARREMSLKGMDCQGSSDRLSGVHATSSLPSHPRDILDAASLTVSSKLRRNPMTERSAIIYDYLFYEMNWHSCPLCAFYCLI